MSYGREAVRLESMRASCLKLLDDLTSPPRERFAVANDSVVKLIQPGIIADLPTGVVRNGTPALAQAIEAEVAEFLARQAGLTAWRSPPRSVSPKLPPEPQTFTTTSCPPIS